MDRPPPRPTDSHLSTSTIIEEIPLSQLAGDRTDVADALLRRVLGAVPESRRGTVSAFNSSI